MRSVLDFLRITILFSLNKANLTVGEACGRAQPLEKALNNSYLNSTTYGKSSDSNPGLTRWRLSDLCVCVRHPVIPRSQ